MSINATVYSTQDKPLSDDFIIVDSDFSEAEAFARANAEAGTKCCIRWSRAEDGQVAYWGPRGATVEPYWYARPGRPEEMSGGKRRNVYMDDASWERALALGNGNASDGIRRALEKAS